MADTYPVRTEPLAVVKTPSLPTTGQVGMKDVLGIQEPYLKEKARLIPEISAARGREAEAKQEQQVIEAEGGAAATKGFAEAEKGAMQQYSTKLEKEPLPAFVPSKENADDLATLFSLVSVIGMVVGGGGRQNAQQAMSAMNGMLEGHQKGRADLYRQELSTFDKSFKSMVQKHAEFRKEMEDAVKLAWTDKEAAMSNAKLAATKAGSTVVNAMLDQGRLLDSYKFVDESQAGVNKAVEAEAKLRADAAKEAAAERRQKEDMAQRVRLAEIRAGSTTGTGLKPGAKVTEAYVADNQLKTDIQDILKDLKTNPSLVNDLKKYRVEAFLTEEGKVLNQLVSEDIPPNLRQFLTKVRDVRNNYYLNISGKAVTGGEALRSYGTVPQPGDSAGQMIDKLSGMSNRVSQAISIKQQLYGLPSLNLNAGGGTSLVPNEDYSRESQGSPAGAGAKQAMPSEARMIEYAKDPYFGGDVEKAKTYLRSKGYQ